MTTAALRPIDRWRPLLGSQLRALTRMIDRHPAGSFGFLTALYFTVTLAQSSVKLLWLDELITVHLAQLGSMHALWQALASGADPNPVLTYVLVHWSMIIFGHHEFAYRLPAMVGYWIGLLCLFVFLRQRLGGSWAIFGCLASMSMAAFDYSFESRSYAIVYGFAMLALLSWSIVAKPDVDPRARRLGLAGMIVALAAGISTNYFAVLAFFPPAVGEVVGTITRFRTRQNNQESSSHRGGPPLWNSVDLPVWLALVVSAAPLMVYLPLIKHSIAEFAPYAWNKVSLSQAVDSYTEMVEIILYPMLALAAAGIAVWIARRWLVPAEYNAAPGWVAAVFAPRVAEPAILPHEAAAILALAAYPFWGYLVASIRGGMMSPRFVIPVCLGFAIAGAVIAQYLFRELPNIESVLIVVVLCWFCCREAVVGYWYKQQKDSFYRVVDSLGQAQQNMPAGSSIAIPDPLLVLTLQHYAPSKLNRSVVFPVDFPAIRYFRHDDSPEENIWAGRSSLYSLPVVTLAEFQHMSAQYLIVAGPKNWMLKDLSQHRYPFAKSPIEPGISDLGGFTPLAHGVLEFYQTSGDRSPIPDSPYSKPPSPFKQSDNLPSAKWYAPPELLDAELPKDK